MGVQRKKVFKKIFCVFSVNMRETEYCEPVPLLFNLYFCMKNVIKTILSVYKEESWRRLITCFWHDLQSEMRNKSATLHWPYFCQMYIFVLRTLKKKESKIIDLVWTYIWVYIQLIKKNIKFLYVYTCIWNLWRLCVGRILMQRQCHLNQYISWNILALPLQLYSNKLTDNNKYIVHRNAQSKNETPLTHFLHSFSSIVYLKIFSSFMSRETLNAVYIECLNVRHVVASLNRQFIIIVRITGEIWKNKVGVSNEMEQQRRYGSAIKYTHCFFFWKCPDKFNDCLQIKINMRNEWLSVDKIKCISTYR